MNRPAPLSVSQCTTVARWVLPAVAQPSGDCPGSKTSEHRIAIIAISTFTLCIAAAIAQRNTPVIVAGIAGNVVTAGGYGLGRTLIKIFNPSHWLGSLAASVLARSLKGPHMFSLVTDSAAPASSVAEVINGFEATAEKLVNAGIANLVKNDPDRAAYLTKIADGIVEGVTHEAEVYGSVKFMAIAAAHPKIALAIQEAVSLGQIALPGVIANLFPQFKSAPPAAV